MTDYQDQLLEKLKSVTDADILNLCADGASVRAKRYAEGSLEQECAIEFRNKVERLFTESERSKEL